MGENNGWGDDYDEDGNVIGEVPEDDPSFAREHAGKLLGVWLVWFALTVPKAGWAESPGIPLGAAVGSAVVAFVLVYGYVWAT